jgi:serine/threonine protein kinase
MLSSYCCFPCYFAPEVLNDNLYSEKCDIWNIGDCPYYMFVGKYPIVNVSQKALFNSIKYHNPSYPEFWFSHLQNLLEVIFIKCAEKINSLSEINNHPWLSDGNILHL